MYSTSNKSSKIIIIFAIVIIPLISCKQSLFQVITHNDVGYWKSEWSPLITEYSKKDSRFEVYDENWINLREGPKLGIWAIYGTKFRITNDTIFYYCEVDGHVAAMGDTLPVVSYSKNTIVIKNRASQYVTLHRIPNKLAKKMMSKNIPYEMDSQSLLSKRFEIKSPEPFHARKTKYKDGVIHFYSFANDTYIIIFEGANMDFTVDYYPPKKQEIREGRKIFTGKNNGMFWRKDILDDGIRIYYNNVSRKDKRMFDEIIDSIKFE